MTHPWEYDALEDFSRKVERTGYGPEREQHEKELGKRKKQRSRQLRKKRVQKEHKHHRAHPVMPEVLRPFTQGRRLLRVPTDEQPMTRHEYARYLTSEHWQRIHEIYAALDLLHQCYVCGDANYELHHLTYARIGHEGLEDLVPLCHECHKLVHKAVKQGVTLRNAHVYVKMRRGS